MKILVCIVDIFVAILMLIALAIIAIIDPVIRMVELFADHTKKDAITLLKRIREKNTYAKR